MGKTYRFNQDNKEVNKKKKKDKLERLNKKSKRSILKHTTDIKHTDRYEDETDGY